MASIGAKIFRWRNLLLGLPVLLLVGWFLYDQILVWTTPEPVWSISVQPMDVVGCSTFTGWMIGEFEEVVGGQTASIGREPAVALMHRFFARRYGRVPLGVADGPHLIRTTFPDGQKRLAWYSLVMVSADQYSMSGAVNALYLDAQTGKPLVFIEGPNASDPCMTCACPIFLPITIDQLRALTLLVCYLVLLAIGLGGAWLWRKVRQGRPPVSSSPAM